MRTVITKNKSKVGKKVDSKSAVVSAIVKVSKRTVAKSTKETITTAYLSKRVLVSVVQRGLSTAAAAAMQNQGFNVIAENGMVVKVFANGDREIVKKIVPVKRPSRITLK